MIESQERVLPSAVTSPRVVPAVTELIVLLLSGAAGILLVPAWLGDSQIVRIMSIWTANVLMVAVAFLGLRFRGQTLAHFGLATKLGDVRRIARGLAQSIAVFFAAIVCFMVGAVLMANLVGMPEGPDMEQYSGLRGKLGLTLIALASVYCVSSFAEEFLYRGFLITRLSELGGGGRAATVIAVSVSSLLFGAIHSDWGLSGMVQTSLMGLALGVSYLRVGRNLWVTILAHAYMDTLLIVSMYLPSPTG